MNDLSVPVTIKTKTLGFITNIKNALTINIQKNHSNNNAKLGSKISDLA